LTSLFSSSGYQVDSFADGAAALNSAMTGDYQGIVLDLKMPHLDGLEFLRKISKTTGSPPCPVIIFSSAEYEYAREEAIRLGAAAFIKKDELDSSHLLAAVAQIINQPS
jgi:CheY-like chemotaxis protein